MANMNRNDFEGARITSGPVVDTTRSIPTYTYGMPAITGAGPVTVTPTSMEEVNTQFRLERNRLEGQKAFTASALKQLKKVSHARAEWLYFIMKCPPKLQYQLARDLRRGRINGVNQLPPFWTNRALDFASYKQIREHWIEHEPQVIYPLIRLREACTTRLVEASVKCGKYEDWPRIRSLLASYVETLDRARQLRAETRVDVVPNWSELASSSDIEWWMTAAYNLPYQAAVPLSHIRMWAWANKFQAVAPDPEPDRGRYETEEELVVSWVAGFRPENQATAARLVHELHWEREPLPAGSAYKLLLEHQEELAPALAARDNA